MILGKPFENLEQRMNETPAGTAEVSARLRIIMNVTSVDFSVCFPELWPLPTPGRRNQFDMPDWAYVKSYSN